MFYSLWPHGLQHARLPILHYLSEFAQIHVRWVSDAILLSSSSAAPFFCFQSFLVSVFSNESALCIRLPKYWCFNISLSSEYSGLIPFRIDWFDFFAVQEILKHLLQHHNSKASILQHSAFFMIQLSHLYMTTGKIIALTIWTFVCKAMSLLFNMLSRFVIAFPPRYLHASTWLFLVPYSFFIFCCSRRHLSRCRHCSKGSQDPTCLRTGSLSLEMSPGGWWIP